VGPIVSTRGNGDSRLALLAGRSSYVQLGLLAGSTPSSRAGYPTHPGRNFRSRRLDLADAMTIDKGLLVSSGHPQVSRKADHVGISPGLNAARGVLLLTAATAAPRRVSVRATPSPRRNIQRIYLPGH